MATPGPYSVPNPLTLSTSCQFHKIFPQSLCMPGRRSGSNGPGRGLWAPPPSSHPQEKFSPSTPQGAQDPIPPRPEVPLHQPVLHFIWPLPVPSFHWFREVTMERGTTHSNCCFAFVSVIIYLSQSLPHQNWVPWIPGSCFP